MAVESPAAEPGAQCALTTGSSNDSWFARTTGAEAVKDLYRPYRFGCKLGLLRGKLAGPLSGSCVSILREARARGCPITERGGVALCNVHPCIGVANVESI